MRAGGAPLVAALTVAASLAVGVLGAGAVDDFLAVSFGDKEPLVAAPREPQPPVAAAPLGTVAVTDLPAGHEADPLLRLARAELVAAVGRRGGTVVDAADGTGPDGVDRVVLGLAGTVPAGADPARHTVEVSAGPGGTVVSLAAPDRRGLAQAAFRLGHALDAGTDLAEVPAGPVEPELDRRWVDTGAVGVVPDPAAYAAQDDYGHASGALSSVVLDEAPWLDPVALRDVERDWEAYVDRMVSYGYDGVVVPGFLEYVTFAGVGTGEDVYPAGSPYAERAVAMREQVGAMWAYADRMGMDVVLVTDMLALTGPLEAYLEAQPGGLDADSAALWDVYAAGVDELLTELPFVDGLMVRVGEAGAVYNLDGWDYYSALEVTTDTQVRTMLRTLTGAAAPHGAEVVLRTWTVGVGEVGDLHTSPRTYERVLGTGAGAVEGLDDLVVSTKFVAGDFDSWLPLNPTLLVGDQPRVVEVQARREFEAFSAFPNDVTGDHAAALQQVAAANPALDGVWVWTQGGGPPRAGPMSLYLTTGFWQTYDLHVWTAAQLAWDTGTDVAAAERAWLRRTWSTEPGTVAALSRVLRLSRAAVLDGLYVRPYAEQEVRAFGLEPPPMLWVFKWDLVSGDTATWSAIYEASRGRVDGAVAGSDRAVATVDAMRAELAATDPATFRDPAQHALLTRSLDYERDLFTTLGAYREAMLRHQEWLATGSGQARRQAADASARYRDLAAEHEARWRGDLDLPPYELAAADRGLQRQQAHVATVWSARVLLLLAAAGLALVRPLRRAALAPWRLDAATWQAAGPRGRLPAVVVPGVVVVGAHAAFGSWVSPVWTALAVGTAAAGTLAAAGVAASLRRRRCPYGPGGGPVVVSVLGPQLLAVVPLLVALAWRGPVGAWSGFWLDPTARAAYVTAAVVAVVWLLVAPALAATACRAGAGAVAAATGGALLVWPGLVGAVVGTERLLTVLNDELQVVPAGLSRILGLTVHLGVPTDLPVLALVAGSTLWLLALVLLRAVGARPRPRPQRPRGAGPRPPSRPQEPSTTSASASHSAST
ncbi:hypothetical protein [Aquipuribacter sp. SD81]|uniref:hypothetical protein n=1 Tax=Aquipuribacter sp. SD81 TaxID=3127703 RepID=UPI003016E85F